MSIEVIIPLCRTAILEPLLASFAWDPPDVITLVTNQPRDILVQKEKLPFELRALRFKTTAYAQGKYDVALRRNVGAHATDTKTLCYFDDDQIASIGMISAGKRLLAMGDSAVWGNYRFIRFEGTDLRELPLLEAHHGRSRERCGQLCLWKSAFGGLLFIERETLLDERGFDMLFTRGSGEDQNLALRLGQTWIAMHEPPFAWHPEEKLAVLPEPLSAVCVECQLVDGAVGNVPAKICRDCPYIERADLSTDSMPKTGPVVPFDPGRVTNHYERLSA